MPHPDEGLIHAWLDGELDAVEATRVEALVANDAAWAAAAAEARGLIASSDRIIRSLDNVPARVLPRPAPASDLAAASPTPLRDRAHRVRPRAAPWWTMRAAAALVVVVGSVYVLTQRGPAVGTPASSGGAAGQVAAPVAAPAAAPAARPVGTALKAEAEPQRAVAAELAGRPGGLAARTTPAAECYREVAPAAGAPAALPGALYRVVRLSDSTVAPAAPAVPPAPAAARNEADVLRDRAERAVWRVRGDTLFVPGTGPATRAAVRVECPPQ